VSVVESGVAWLPHRAVGPPPWSRTTTGRLRLASVALAVTMAVFAGCASLTVVTRQSATRAAGQTTEPLLVDAQMVYTALSDADTTAAGGLLSGPVEPGWLRSRYQLDLATAAAAVTDAAERGGQTTAVSTALRGLSVGIPFYAGLVERAQTNNRLGYPVAAAYQAEASNFLRTSLLPAANVLFRTQMARLSRDQSTGTTLWPGLLSLLLVGGVLAVLVIVQAWLRVRFHRRFNVLMIMSTVLVALLGVWGAVALAGQGARIDDAAKDGTRQLAVYTQARQLALQARADDELTLISRGSVASYQVDYATVWPRLDATVRAMGDPAVAAAAADVFSGHQVIATLIGVGDFVRASASASGPGRDDLPAASARLDAALVSGLGHAQKRFDMSTAQAMSDLSGLAFGVVALTLVAAVLALTALNARSKEYR